MMAGIFTYHVLSVIESLNMLKKLLFPLVALFMLAGCATPPTTIDVAPKITLPQQDPSLMGVTVSITGADQRQDQALAKVTRNNQLVTLTASRDLRFLLQEVLEKQMTARGYMIGLTARLICRLLLTNCMLMFPRAACATTSRPKRISRLLRPRQMAAR